MFVTVLEGCADTFSFQPVKLFYCVIICVKILNFDTENKITGLFSSNRNDNNQTPAIRCVNSEKKALKTQINHAF